MVQDYLSSSLESSDPLPLSDSVSGSGARIKNKYTVNPKEKTNEN